MECDFRSLEKERKELDQPVFALVGNREPANQGQILDLLPETFNYSTGGTLPAIIEASIWFPLLPGVA